MKDAEKTYTRTEHCGGYIKITDINSEGDYYQRNVWPDGIITGESRTTLQTMGWRSVTEFLHNRKGFILTDRKENT